MGILRFLILENSLVSVPDGGHTCSYLVVLFKVVYVNQASIFNASAEFDDGSHKTNLAGTPVV